MTTADKPAPHAPTAADLKAAIAKRYEPPEWHLEHEVTLDGRRLDVVAFNLWGARDFHVSGFELKVSRADWIRELDQFQKSERWCEVVDAFYLVTPPGLVMDGELPHGWGHLELRGARMYTKAHAVQRPKGRTLPREVVARFLTRMAERTRNAERNADWKARQALRDEVRAEVQASVEKAHERDRQQLRELRDERATMFAALGIDAGAWRAHEQVLRASVVFQRAREHGIVDMTRRLEMMVTAISAHHEQLSTALADLRALQGVE